MRLVFGAIFPIFILLHKFRAARNSRFKWFCKNDFSGEAFFDISTGSCPSVDDVTRPNGETEFFSCWDGVVCLDVEKSEIHENSVVKFFVGNGETLKDLSELCNDHPTTSKNLCKYDRFLSSSNSFVPSSFDPKEEITPAPTPIPTLPPPLITKYFSEITYVLVNSTVANFTESRSQDFKQVVVNIMNGSITNESVIIRSLNQNTQTSTTLVGRMLLGSTSSSNESLEDGLTMAPTMEPTTAVTPPPTVEVDIKNLEVTFKLGLDEDCEVVEELGRQISEVEDIFPFFEEYGFPVSDAYQLGNYKVVLADEFGKAYLDPVETCSDYSDVSVGNSEAPSNISGNAGLIVGLILLGIFTCVVCSVVYNKFFMDNFMANKLHLKRCVSVGAWCIVPNGLNNENVLHKTRINSGDIENFGETLKLLTVETVFCNALAKESLRQFMLEQQMEEIFLFFEKMTDQVLRPFPKGSAMAAAFKMQMIEEFIDDNALHKLDISDDIRKQITEDTSTEISSMLPLLKLVHMKILEEVWSKWIESEGFADLMGSSEMKMAGFAYAMDRQSQVDMADRTKAGKPASNTIPLSPLLSPLWVNIPGIQKEVRNRFKLGGGGLNKNCQA